MTGEGERCAAAVRRRRRWVWGMGLGAAVALLLGALFLSSPEPDPLVRGRPLGAWLTDFDSVDPAARREAEAVVRALGTNALPQLARALGRRDPWYLQSLQSNPSRWTWRVRRWLAARMRPHEAMAERRRAMRGLLLLGTNVPPELLGDALRDSDGGVASLAAQGLSGLGEPALPVLTRLIVDAEPGVRSMALGAMSRLGEAAAPAVPQLVVLLADGDSNVVRQAVYVLGQIGRPAVPALATVVAGTGEVHRLAALDALVQGRPASREAVAVLVPLAGDPNVEVRLRVLAGLAYSLSRRQELVPVYAAALESTDRRERLAALEALRAGWPRGQMLTGAVERCLTDPDPEVAAAARRILQR